jgi:hypothetical protein
MENSILKLVTLLGGREEVAKRINAIRLSAKGARCDGMPELTKRMVSWWWQENFALGWRQLLLAAAIDAGISAETAIEICPELQVVQHYARLTSTERAA